MLNSYRYHVGKFSIQLDTVSLAGTDVVDFFQNQSTYDVEKIPEAGFQLLSFLDPQGRVETYGWLLKKENSFQFLFPKSLRDQTIIRLNKFLISEDVEISEPETKDWFVTIGPEAKKTSSSFEGVLFDEKAYLSNKDESPELKNLTSDEISQWRGLTGWPSFDGSDYSHEIINNLRLFDLALVQNKGCYPGQETVSKIATRRGAAYSPVLVELPSSIEPGDLVSFEKRIGKSSKCYEWEGKFYLASDLLRDFRVEGMKIHFSIGGKEHDGIVRYYPLISGSPHEKAKELFYAGSDFFMADKLDNAEENFKLAIKLDPAFADVYESLGVMLGRQNRYDEAIEWMKQLSEVDPKSVLAHTNMSLFLMKQGKISEAEEQKSLATVKSFQSFGEEAKNKDVQAAIKKKQQEEWIQRESMFKQVLEIDPDDTLANYGLGSIAVEKSEWEIARTHLEKVLEQDPKYSVAYLALGRALKGLGLKAEAKAIWTEGIKVSAAKGDLMPANQMQQELNF